jgi:rhamnulokinase
MPASNYLAIDLGAASGRTMVGKYDGKHLEVEEIHRFSNKPIWSDEHLHWDISELLKEIKHGIYLGAKKYSSALRSIGLDTWGVDFGLLDVNDHLIENPFHYRDSRTNGMLEYAFSRVPPKEIFEYTGIQFMQLNSLYQLLAMVKSESVDLALAETFLNMPDLFNFFLTGNKVNEFTIATTTQCYDPVKRNWASDLLDRLGIPIKIFGEIIPTGTILGRLRPALADELGLPSTLLIASASHDTASAAAAVPASNKDYIYLSSGTWSILGVEIDQPKITPESMEAEMTNEGSAGNKICFQKNIAGLWLIQECRQQWMRQGIRYSYDDLTQMASGAPAFGSIINPGDSRFLAPNDMPSAIQTYCQETGQTVPEGKDTIVRCALESLALEYRTVVEQIERLMGRNYPVIHIIGGGTQNQLLNQMTADATGRIVISGPVEATAIGNILVQAVAMGDIASLVEGRAIVRDSFKVETYFPSNTAAWEEAFHFYQHMMKKKNDPAIRE